MNICVKWSLFASGGRILPFPGPVGSGGATGMRFWWYRWLAGVVVTVAIIATIQIFFHFAFISS